MSATKNPFQKITINRHFIIDCYVKMLSRINEYDIIQLINSESKDVSSIKNSNIPIEKVVQSLSIYFQLMTLVEENAATQYRRAMENEAHVADIRG